MRPAFQARVVHLQVGHTEAAGASLLVHTPCGIVKWEAVVEANLLANTPCRIVEWEAVVEVNPLAHTPAGLLSGRRWWK